MRRKRGLPAEVNLFEEKKAPQVEEPRELKAKGKLKVKGKWWSAKSRELDLQRKLRHMGYRLKLAQVRELLT